MTIGQQHAGQQAARGRQWRLLSLPVAMLAMAGCSSSDARDWRGYAYPDLMGGTQAQVSGPYASGPQCLAFMRAAQQGKPRTAGFACARGCKLSKQDDASGEHLLADCDEVLR